MVLAVGLGTLVAAFGLFTAVYVTWAICQQRRVRRQHIEAVKETIHLVLYPVFNAMICIIWLVMRIHYYVNDLSLNCRIIIWWLSSLSLLSAGIVTTLALLFHVILTEYRRRKRKRNRQRSESETRYTVPPEFPSEVGPLVITGARPQEPETAYNTIYLTETVTSIN